MKTFSNFAAICVVAFMAFSQFALAKSLSLGLSEESAELNYNTGGDYASSIDYGITGFYNSVEVGDKNVSQTDILVTIDMETALEGESTSNFLFSLGGHVYGLSLDRLPQKTYNESKNELHTGIMLGGKVGFLLVTTKPSLVYAEGRVSPNIVNIGKVETLVLMRLVYELQLSPATLLQVGYRYYGATFRENTRHLGEKDKDIEDNIFAGIRLRF